MGFTSTQAAQGAMTAQVGGLAMSTVGAYYAAKSQQSAQRYQADIADINAKLAEQGAQSALQQGQQQAGSLTLRAGQMKSAQRASMAANGIDLGQGNAAEITASTDLMKEIDANTITANAARSAWGYRTQETNLQNEALTRRATADGISPWGTATSSLLTGAGNVALSWYKAGMFDKSAADPTAESDPVRDTWYVGKTGMVKPSMPDFMRGGR